MGDAAARLQVRQDSTIAERGILVTVSCPHGTTSVHAGNVDDSEVDRDSVAAVAVASHHLNERCGCTTALRLRYLTRRIA